MMYICFVVKSENDVHPERVWWTDSNSVIHLDHASACGVGLSFPRCVDYLHHRSCTRWDCSWNRPEWRSVRDARKEPEWSNECLLREFVRTHRWRNCWIAAGLWTKPSTSHSKHINYSPKRGVPRRAGIERYLRSSSRSNTATTLARPSPVRIDLCWRRTPLYRFMSNTGKARLRNRFARPSHWVRFPILNNRCSGTGVDL